MKKIGIVLLSFILVYILIINGDVNSPIKQYLIDKNWDFPLNIMRAYRDEKLIEHKDQLSNAYDKRVLKIALLGNLDYQHDYVTFETLTFDDLLEKDLKDYDAVFIGDLDLGKLDSETYKKVFKTGMIFYFIDCPYKAFVVVDGAVDSFDIGYVERIQSYQFVRGQDDYRWIDPDSELSFVREMENVLSHIEMIDHDLVSVFKETRFIDLDGNESILKDGYEIIQSFDFNMGAFYKDKLIGKIEVFSEDRVEKSYDLYKNSDSYIISDNGRDALVPEDFIINVLKLKN